jgi:hypothetical protein
MKKVIEWLRGKKTYIVMFLGIIVSGLLAQGYITKEQSEVIVMVLGFLGLGTLRLGIERK